MTDGKEISAGGSAGALAAAAAGTLFVWYDFFLFVPFGALIGSQFLPGDNGGGDYLFALFAVAAGLVMRPIGALVFGRMGDARGRKPALLAAMLVMGVASLLVGLLPTRAQIGLAAPVLLILLRLIQGFAIGGAPFGAALLAAEAAPGKSRGLWTGLVMGAATAGLALSLGAAMVARGALTGPALESWVWRVPFLASAVLLALWAWLRLKLPETLDGPNSRPLREAFGRPNLKRLILAILGLSAGQAVIWHAANLYSLTFLENVLQTAPEVAEGLMLPALVIGAPAFVAFGWLSDRVGRKWVIMAGCGLFAAGSIPLFQALTDYVQPSLREAQQRAAITVVSDPRYCSILFSPTGRARHRTSCDVAKDFLTRAGLPFKQLGGAPGELAAVQVGKSDRSYIFSFRGQSLSDKEFQALSDDFARRVGTLLAQEQYPAQADPKKIERSVVIAILSILLVLAAMVTAPLAAMLAEMFPARVRSTSANVAYQVGQAWVGGLLPATAFALISSSGVLTQGLLYAIFFAALALIVGGINLADPRRLPAD